MRVLTFDAVRVTSQRLSPIRIISFHQQVLTELSFLNGHLSKRTSFSDDTLYKRRPQMAVSELDGGRRADGPNPRRRWDFQNRNIIINHVIMGRTGN